MSHVHPCEGCEFEERTIGATHDCPGCLAREKAQEELVAEFVRQEERIETLTAELEARTDSASWRAMHSTIAAREEEVRRLREALGKIEQHASNRYWELPAEPWAADLSVVAADLSVVASIAREALSSLDDHATKD